jgi:hypothetical protein
MHLESQFFGRLFDSLYACHPALAGLVTFLLPTQKKSKEDCFLTSPSERGWG